MVWRIFWAPYTGVRIPVEARLSAPVQTSPGSPPPASCTMGTGSLPGVKRPGRGVDHPPPSSAEVNERVKLHLLHLCAFVACYRVKFTFTFGLHTVQNVSYPEDGGSKLAQYASNYLPTNITPYTQSRTSRTLKTEAPSSPNTPVTTYQQTRRHKPQELNLRQHLSWNPIIRLALCVYKL
jgi:hypothetical protein